MTPDAAATPDLASLARHARSIRRLIIRMTTAAGSGHPSSSLSAVEALTALYLGGILRHRPHEPHWRDRDRFILSKGHAAPGLYAALAESGYFPAADTLTLRKLGSPLEGHPNMRRLPGIEASTGSLGQGLSIGVGCAIAARLDRRPSHTFVLLGDGEIGEGQVWEAAMSVPHLHLTNITAMVDHNGYQQTGAHEAVLNLRPIADRWRGFGWEAHEIDGHDQGAVYAALAAARGDEKRAHAIVLKTRKGQGILPVLEALKDVNYHGKALPDAAAAQALDLLKD